jgi:hypothetical protein
MSAISGSFRSPSAIKSRKEFTTEAQRSGATTKPKSTAGDAETRRKTFGIKKQTKSNSQSRARRKAGGHGEEEAAKVCAKKKEFEIRFLALRMFHASYESCVSPRNTLVAIFQISHVSPATFPALHHQRGFA